MALNVERLEPDFFLSVEKPDRYLGRELSLPVLPPDPNLRVALAFPDLYELGMSYLGFRILLHLASQIEGIACERVFMPWFDAERILRSLKIPLFTLETRTPLKGLDLIGFNLQYELHATNVLAMLDLGGIPLRADQRGEDDPIVLGGGPLAFHPESFAPFFDAIAVGDGEDVFPEILRRLNAEKTKGTPRREGIRALGDIDGVYLPGYYEPQYNKDGRYRGLKSLDPGLKEGINARITPQLLPEYYPLHPIVPHLETTHNRLVLEIARGCSRGCRFCGPGMTKRPVRERSVADLVNEAETGLAATGYSQVSLLSLSAADYSQLDELLDALDPLLEKRQVSLSFPSLRPDRFTARMADRAAAGSRTGLTLAPEAATPRLRAVINKETTDEDLLKAVRLAFERQWKSVKLYFMIGLPTETDEDVHALVKLVEKAVVLAREFGGRRLNVAVSPFSPKPHTPFEREAQLPPCDLRRRIAILRDGLRRYSSVRLEIRDLDVARVETAIARGDRRTADAIEHSYRAGGIFDAWSDGFSIGRWEEAFRQAGLDLKKCCGRIPKNGPLPWDHIAAGVAEEFLVSEKKAAKRAEFTPDCRERKCNLCGLQLHPDLPCPEIVELPPVKWRKKAPNTEPAKTHRRFRLIYRRAAESRFTAHLDVLGILERALRRLGSPLEFTEGMKPHPRLIASPPLAVGMTSQAEYLDFGIADDLIADHPERLQATLPIGYQVVSFIPVPEGGPSLGSLDTFLYKAVQFSEMRQAEVSQAIADLLASGDVPILRTGPRKARTFNARPLIWRLEESDDGVIWIGLKSLGGPVPRAAEILELIAQKYDGDLTTIWNIERAGMWWNLDGVLYSPEDEMKRMESPAGNNA